MANEREFVNNGLKKSRIDEFFEEELGRAGYGGMELARTPMGTEIELHAEKPGMVIGKGGKNIRDLTDKLEERFDVEDPQIDVQEVTEPDLNARIVADRLANALERGWHFRDAGQTTVRKIMDAGARGAEIVFSGKVTGARSRVEKFSDGYIKHCGEPAEEIVDSGYGTAVMKLGTIGVQVRIIPPDAELPDTFVIEDVEDVEDLIPEAEKAEPEVEEAETQEAEGIEEIVEEETERVEEEDEEEAEAEPEPEEETGAEEEEGDETPPEPETLDDLEEMSYRELQLLAKDVGVKANLSREEMTDELADEFGVGGDS
ncbi:MAG: 30S ribosomal protein S3 [Halobacteria archaeon]|nr:30S ribosomal protein S3 [Halobacteria archaeon]